MHVVLYFCDVRRLDSTVAFNVLTKYVMLRLNNQILYKFEVYGMNLLLS